MAALRPHAGSLTTGKLVGHARWVRSKFPAIDADGVVGEAIERVLRKGLDVADGAIVRGFVKNVALEHSRKLATQHRALEQYAVTGEGDGKERRKKPARAHSAAELESRLLEHAAAVLSDFLGYAWTDGHTAELRDAVGVDEPDWPDGLTVRRAVVVSLDSQAFFLNPLGKALPPSVVAAACVIAGERVRLSAKELGKGVTVGSVIDRIVASLKRHRDLEGTATRRQKSEPRKRKSAKVTR
jgi:hypothetical protein